jgi:hypothetical protein
LTVRSIVLAFPFCRSVALQGQHRRLPFVYKRASRGMPRCNAMPAL